MNEKTLASAISEQENAKIANAIWVVKPRSKVLHIIPEKRFVPALCGTVPPGKGKTPGQWSTVYLEYVQRVKDNAGQPGSALCEKCLKALLA